MPAATAPIQVFAVTRPGAAPVAPITLHPVTTIHIQGYLTLGAPTPVPTFGHR